MYLTFLPIWNQYSKKNLSVVFPFLVNPLFLSKGKGGPRMGGNKRNVNVNVLQVPSEVVQVCLATVIQS